MNFTQYMNKHAKMAKVFQEIIGKNALVVEKHKEVIAFGHHFNRVQGLPNEVLHAAKSIADKIEIVITGSALANGPKVFRPKQLDFEMLEQMSVNLGMADYVQPFQTIIVELPEGYYKNKQVHNALDGVMSYGLRQPPTHCPVFVGLHWLPEANCLMAMVNFTSDVSIKIAFVLEEADTFEQFIENMDKKDEFSGSLETNNQEWGVTKDVIRAALNYALLVDEIGLQSRGPDNPKYYKRLQHFASKGNSKEELAAHPFVYELKQEVKLYHTVNSHSELSDGEGTMKTPHHRRGHYRMQRYGPGREMRKRIRIAPIFVNKYLFLGNMGDAKASYE